MYDTKYKRHDYIEKNNITSVHEIELELENNSEDIFKKNRKDYRFSTEEEEWIKDRGYRINKRSMKKFVKSSDYIDYLLTWT